MTRTGVDSIGRNAVLSLAVQLTTATFTAVLTLYLVRALGAEGYGTFALALAVGTLLVIPSDFGLSASAARFIAERRGDRGAIAGILVDTLKLKLVLAGLASTALFAAAGPVADAFEEPGLTWPLRAIALAVLGQSLMLLFSFSFIAQARADRNLALVGSESAVEAGASIALVLLGAGAAGAGFGRASGYLFGAVLGLLLTVRLLGKNVLATRARTPGRARAIAGYAGAAAVVDWSYTLFDQIDALLIGAYLGSTSVGVFQAPMRITSFLLYPCYAIANAVAPRVARGREEPNVRAFTAALRISIVFQAAVATFVLVWAGPIVDLLLGDGYDEADEVLRALTPFVFLTGFAPLVSLSANYLGLARRRVPLAVAAILINLAIDVALIPRIGVVAGAIGTDVAFTVYTVGHLWLCKGALDVPLRPILVSAARAGLAAAALAGVLLVVGTHDLPLWKLVGGGLGGAAAYVLVLLATRELTVRQIRSAAARFQRRRMG